jgi:hypothetical protein
MDCRNYNLSVLGLKKTRGLGLVSSHKEAQWPAGPCRAERQDEISEHGMELIAFRWEKIPEIDIIKSPGPC